MYMSIYSLSFLVQQSGHQRYQQSDSLSQREEKIDVILATRSAWFLWYIYIYVQVFYKLMIKNVSWSVDIAIYIRGLLASGMRSRRRWIPWPPILLASDPSSRMPWMEIWRTYIWAAGLGWSKSSKSTWKFFLVNRDLRALWKNWAPGCQAEEKPSRDYGWIDWIWQENGANHWQKTEVWKIRFFQVVLRYTGLIDFSYCYFKIQKSLETCRAKFQLIRI